LKDFAQILNFEQEEQVADDLDALRIRLPPFKKKNTP
jgi:hypothetical protein